MRITIPLILTAHLASAALAQTPAPSDAKLIQVADAWAKSSVNTVIFRHNSLVTFGDIQYTAFYDNDAKVILAKRKLSESTWQLKNTGLSGNAADAHNTITLGMDGTGILHMSWDHHGNNLNYVHTKAPGTLELTDRLKMDGVRETQVTYPEFYTLPDGDMFFLYRVGQSGNGDLVLKRFHPAGPDKEGAWTTVAQNLVAGEGRQNAYPEFCVDPKGTLHLGWVWRRTGDVATNHDICYAKSADGGKTWTDSTGKLLALPITAATCEVAMKIPEKSELINQTTITADAAGHPYIATYFRKEGQSVPQYEVIYNDGTTWKSSQVGERKTPFSLAGGGTKRIPISRPLMIADSSVTPIRLTVVFRDVERGDQVSIATTSDISKGHWDIQDVTQMAGGWGSWEPSYDPTLWAAKRKIALVVQKTDQVDGGDNARRTDVPASKLYVLEFSP
jgi:hypothetical protein